LLFSKKRGRGSILSAQGGRKGPHLIENSRISPFLRGEGEIWSAGRRGEKECLQVHHKKRRTRCCPGATSLALPFLSKLSSKRGGGNHAVKERSREIEMSFFRKGERSSLRREKPRGKEGGVDRKGQNTRSGFRQKEEAPEEKKWTGRGEIGGGCRRKNLFDPFSERGPRREKRKLG